MQRIRRSKNPFFLAILLGILPVLVLSIYRSFYGFDWSDETYYTALSFRFILGDRLFLNSWDIHQTSSVVTIPLVALYRFLSGNTDGILLFMRLCYVGLTGIVALYALYVLTENGTVVTAAVSACLIILFVPGNIGTWSYNTMSLQFMFLSWLMLVNEKRRMRTIRLIFSGVFYALSVQCYPYLFLVLPVYMAWFIVYSYREINHNIIKPQWIWLIGLLTICVCFILYILITSASEIEKLLSNLGYLFSDPEHPAKNYLVSLRGYFASLASVMGKTGIVIISMSFVLLLFFLLQKNIDRKHLKDVLVIILIGLTAACFYQVWISLPDDPSCINMLALPLALVGPALYFLIGRKGGALVPLYFSGWIFSLTVHLASNNGLNHSVYPLILSSIAVISYVGACLKSNDIPHAVRSYLEKIIVITGSAVLIMILLGTGYLRVSYVYRDESIPKLTTRMEDGPTAGLYTTKESALKYEEVIAAIHKYAPDTGTAFYTKLLPFGYLSENLRPATPSIWRTPVNSPRLSQYYDLYPELKPDFIFVVDDNYGISNENNQMEGALSEMLNEIDYGKIDLECGTVYLRRGNGNINR